MMNANSYVVDSDKPCVTISIPTMNSGRFIGRCLEAISAQTYKHIEVNIIDGGSADETLEIAKKHGVQEVMLYSGGLLGARELGARIARGSIIVLLDSDQILEPDAIERAVLMSRDHHMLVLEEDVFSNVTFVEKLFYYDRKLIHSVKDFNPYTGAMLPRVYQSAILHAAFSAVSPKVLEKVGGQDHAIIYYEAWKISHSVGLVSGAVKHIEPASFMALWRKFYRWGYTSNNAHQGEYRELVHKKERFRSGMFKPGLFVASLGSIVLLAMKGAPYAAGLMAARLKRN